MDRIHISQIWAEMQKKDRQGNFLPFSFSYAKQNGTIAEYSAAYFSSIHTKGSTVNVFVNQENKPKTFRRISFVKFNGQRIYI